MRKKLLLVTAFLAVAGTAMAVTDMDVINRVNNAEDKKIIAIDAKAAKDKEEILKEFTAAEKTADAETDQAKKESLKKANKEKKEKAEAAVDTRVANEKKAAKEAAKMGRISTNTDDAYVDMANVLDGRSPWGDMRFEDREIKAFEGKTKEEVKTEVDNFLTTLKTKEDTLSTKETERQPLATAFAEKKTAFETKEREWRAAGGKDSGAEFDAKETAKNEYETAKTALEAKDVEVATAKEELAAENAKGKEVLDALGLSYAELMTARKNSMVKNAPEAAVKAFNDKKEKVEEAIDKRNEENKLRKEFANYYVYGSKEEPAAEAASLEKAAQVITKNAMDISENKKAIAKNAQDIRDLRKDHNKGMAQMAAMASVDFGNVKARTVKVGAGIGQHASETAVAVGVAVTPTDALMINAKWSTSTNSIKKSTLGLGATYEFNF